MVIPTKWVYSLDIVQIFNKGINPRKTHKVFYYKDKSIDADFTLPVRDIFDENVPACYHAQIKCTFGKN